MPIIQYKFDIGHIKEIEVSEEVAATFDELNKYEKKVERKETRRHISMDRLKENGFEKPDTSANIDVVLLRFENESREIAEKARQKVNLIKKSATQSDKA